MKYIIASLIIYDTESGIICGYADKGAAGQQHLTNTANRILSLLLTSPGEIIARDDLLEQVWIAHGQVASNSSLNQYVSILRKTLTKMTGISDTIISHPRVGFSFSAAINVRLDEAESVHDALHITESEISPDTQKTEEKNNPSSKRFLKKLEKYTLPVSGVLLIILLLITLSQYYRDDSNANSANMSVWFSVGKCQIKSDQQTRLISHEKIIPVMSGLIPDIIHVCEKTPSQVFFKAENSVFYGREGRVFVAFCRLGSEENKLMYCETFYAYNWKKK